MEREDVILPRVEKWLDTGLEINFVEYYEYQGEKELGPVLGVGSS